MLASLVITLREGVEAALVVGIILIYLRRTGREALAGWVYIGLAAGLVASLIAAALFAALEVAEEAYEGWLMIAGAVCVLTMVVWMLRTGRALRRTIESRLDALTTAGTGPGRDPRAVGAGLFGLTFVLVLREGVETALFLAAVNLTTDALLAFAGGVAGIGLAVVFGFAFVRGTVRIDLQRFFTLTAIVLFVLAAQLLIGGLHELGEQGTIPIGRAQMRLIGPIVKADALVLASLLALPLLALLVPGRVDRRRVSEAESLEGPERRLALARLQRERRWRRAFSIAGLLVVASLTVSYALTRLPREIDPPHLLTAQSGVDVRIPAAGLDDGHLHRFGVPIEGTVVRFFVMKSGAKLVPSFDACQVCGPYGYIETQGRLICLACAADINTLSLGVGGGCNPLPLAHRLDGGDLVISWSALAAEAATFRGADAEIPPPPAVP